MSNIKRILIFVIILFCGLFKLKCEEAKSSDSLYINQNNNKGFNMYAVGGIGFDGFSGDFWGAHFKSSPIYLLGIEIPFSKSHEWAFEFNTHFWVADTIPLKNDYNHQFRNYYIKYSDNSYCQFGISAIFKYYLIDYTKFRMSIHLGWLIPIINKLYSGLDFGLGIYYKYDDDLLISLNSNIFHHLRFSIDGGNGNNYAPSIMSLKMYYKIKGKK